MKKQSKLMTFLMSLLLAFMLAVPGNAVSTQAAGQGDMAVHFIDVGQGLAILVQSGGENLLYDGGNRAHADEVVQYLKNQQVETIDYMISSHYDEDHLGGLVKCLDNFEVEHVLGSDYVHTSDLFNTFMNTATAHAIIVEYPSVGDTYEFGTGSFTVMAPDGISQNSNDNSLVIKLENGSNSFIFTGDAEEKAEEDILNNGIDISADVYAAAHHGSKTATSQAFLDKVSPTYVVISAGEGNKYGHPHAEVLNRLRAAGKSVFRTDEQGTIVATSDGNDITWNCSPSESWKAGEPTGSSDSTANNSTADSTTSSGSSDAGIAADESGSSNSDSSSVMVHITDTGSKYHSAGCSYLKKSDHEVTLSEAKNMGLTPCSRCNPPQ